MQREKYSITNGQSLFQVYEDSNKFTYTLFFNHRPIFKCWDDCQGSIAQYIMQSSYNPEYIEKAISQIHRIVENGVDKNSSLSESFKPLLNLFSNGDYTLDYFESSYVSKDKEEQNLISNLKSESLEYSEYFESGIESYENDLMHVYPYNTLLFTRDPAKLNRNRILEFIDLIEDGLRPIIIIFSFKDYNFVIDGHHKAVAYAKLNITPSIFNITQISNPPKNLLPFDYQLNLIKDLQVKDKNKYHIKGGELYDFKEEAIDAFLKSKSF